MEPLFPGQVKLPPVPPGYALTGVQLAALDITGRAGKRSTPSWPGCCAGASRDATGFTVYAAQDKDFDALCRLNASVGTCEFELRGVCSESFGSGPVPQFPQGEDLQRECRESVPPDPPTIVSSRHHQAKDGHVGGPPLSEFPTSVAGHYVRIQASGVQPARGPGPANTGSGVPPRSQRAYTAVQQRCSNTVQQQKESSQWPVPTVSTGS